MLAIKYTFYILFIYFTLLIATLSFIFTPLKDEIINKHININQIFIDNFELKAKKYILNNNYEPLLEDMIKLKETGILNKIKISYIKHYITVDSLLSHSNNIKTKDWILNDITTDSSFGIIEKYTDTIYKFIPEEDYEFQDDIEIKFQALNDTQMQNSISTINFTLPTLEIQNEKLKTNQVQDYLKSILKLEDKIREKKFLINNIDNFAKIEYIINNNKTFNEIYNSLKQITIYFTVLFFLIIFLILISNYYLFQIAIIKYLKELESYASDVLSNRFYKFNSSKLKNKNLIQVAQVIGKISKKTSSIINELNVNKNTLELQVSTDNLTKLPNSKIFENDLKSLFLTNIHSYITLIKLEALNNFAKNNTQDETDKLILDFIEILVNITEKYNTKNTKIYRIYGSEFIIISKYADFKIMSDIFEDFAKSMINFKKNFNIDNKVYFATSIPFDHYGTTEKLLKHLEDNYSNNIDSNQSHSIEKPDEIDEKDLLLEKVVTSIIKNDAFSLSYKFDTYLFAEPDILVMKEVAANLTSTDGSIIPIGTFISVAEHLNLAIEFDKQLIVKVFKFIKKNNITYDLAINISISSINDMAFINWLEAEILYDYKNILEKVVFSVTTFAAKNNFDTFVDFSSNIRKFGGRVLLKRFSYNDLKLEQLEALHLDFIRVHKDYTTNIDVERKVVLKNIVNFSVIHDIRVLGDLVSDKSDYDVLKGIKFYATSK